MPIQQKKKKFLIFSSDPFSQSSTHYYYYLLLFILLCVHSLKLSHVKLRDMIALLDNVQILVISKKLVNKLHSVGFITSLWLTRLVTSLLVVIILHNIRLFTVTILLR